MAVQADPLLPSRYSQAAVPALTDTRGLAIQAPQTEDVLEALRDVVDPELGINVVDRGLVYGVTLGGDGVATISMTLTSAACPLTDVIEEQAASALEGLVTDFRINWVWCPRGPGQDHRGRPRATPRPGLQRLARPAASASLP